MVFLILFIGLYNVYDLVVKGVFDEVCLLLGNLLGVEVGLCFVQYVVELVFLGFGRLFVVFVILLFVFIIILVLYYMVEINVSYLCWDCFGWVMIIVFQLLFLVVIGYLVINIVMVVWVLGDIGVGMMSWLNIIVIFLLQKLVLVVLCDYEQQRYSKCDLLFNLQMIGMCNMWVWES